MNAVRQMTATSITRTSTTVASGRLVFNAEPMRVPTVLPTPAAPTTNAINIVTRSSQPANGSERRMNAMNNVKSPDRNRNPLLQRRALTTRSEEHTSELQSRGHLVCRLLLDNQ